MLDLGFRCSRRCAGHNTPEQKAVVQHLANAFLPLAATFNCAKFGWGSFRKSTIELEYVPPGDNVASWTRSMTISVFQLPKETPTQTEVMQKLEEHLLAEFQKGNVIDQAILQTNDGFPRMLIECEAGDGIQKERAAGAFLKLMATTAQFIRIWA